MKFDRLFCFGDSITLGYNDSEGLGWPGRLGRDLTCGDRSVATYNLGVNGDTSRDIALRWRHELEARSRNMCGPMLFAFGFNDAARSDGGDCQVDLASSLDYARQTLTEARRLAPLLWIGPTPLDESVNPMQTDFDCWDMRNDDISRYDEAYADLAQKLEVNYLQLFPDFLASPRYRAALLAGDRVHPGDDGYAMIAEHIDAWDKWRGEILNIYR